MWYSNFIIVFLHLILQHKFFLGKHCLNSVFANDNFPNQAGVTLHQNYSSNIYIEGLKVYLDLHKTPGPEEYDAIRPLYYPKTVRPICFKISKII